MTSTVKDGIETRERESPSRHSLWTHISFNLVLVMLPAIWGMFGTHFFWFYEVELGMPVLLVGLANVILTIWDAFNDPLVGYISDQPNRLSRRFGRRFPYIVLAGIPTLIAFVMVFLPPVFDAKTQPIPAFLWLLFWLLILELGYTTVNLARALFPEKFRTEAERKKNAGIGMVTGVLGMSLGMTVPMVLVSKGDVSSYWIGAVAIAGVSLVLFFLGIPGVREDKKMVQQWIREDKPRPPFLQAVRQSLKKKNFVMLIVINVAIQVFSASALGSIYYYLFFVVGVPEDSLANVIFLVLWFTAGLVSVPFWIFIARKIGNKNVQLAGILATAASSLAFFFVKDLTGALIGAFVFGFCQGASTFVRSPLFSDVVDEAALLDKTRQEGIYLGVQAFFDRLGILLQPLIFTVVHLLTGFEADAAVQTPLAQFGILAGMFLIPGVLLLIAGFFFWRHYDLSPARTQRIKEQLDDLY